MMHTCVVTGATGYIGSHLVSYLVNKGWNVHVIVRPSSCLDMLQKIRGQIHVFCYDGNIHSMIMYFKQIEAEVVFHVAAAVISNYKPEQVTTLLQSNIEFGTEILESMKYSHTRLIISTGSYWQNYDSDVYNPVDLYASTKEAFEKILQYYVDAHYFRVITLRLFDVYGEDDKRPKLLNLLRNIAGTEKSIDISPGEQYLDMVHVSDVCSAYLSAYQFLIDNVKIGNEVFGVLTKDRIQLKDLVTLYSQISGKSINVNIGAKPYKQREIMNPTLSYKILPNWHAKITLTDGLNLFVNHRGGVKNGDISKSYKFAA